MGCNHKVLKLKLLQAEILMKQDEVVWRNNFKSAFAFYTQNLVTLCIKHHKIKSQQFSLTIRT